MKRWKIKAKKMEGNTFRERRERLREGKDSEKEKGKGRMNKIGKGKRDQKEKRERKRQKGDDQVCMIVILYWSYKVRYIGNQFKGLF